VLSVAASTVANAVPPGLRIEGLTLRYGARTIFENLDLSLAGGEFVVLLGTSGVGKSSLLKIVAGLSRPTEGRVAATDGLPLHHRIAYMGQQDLLYPWLNVVENVMLSAFLREKSLRGARQLAEATLADVDSRYTEVRRKIEALGPVNPQALEEFEEAEQNSIPYSAAFRVHFPPRSSSCCPLRFPSGRARRSGVGWPPRSSRSSLSPASAWP